MKKWKVCSFTGSRCAKITPAELVPKVKELIKHGYNCFAVGGAIGFDMSVSLAIIELKKQYSDIKLISIVPWRTWYEKFTTTQKSNALYIIQNSDKCICTSNTYRPWVYTIRNAKLISDADVLISYQVKNSKGTADAIQKAKNKGIPIISWI